VDDYLFCLDRVPSPEIARSMIVRGRPSVSRRTSRIDRGIRDVAKSASPSSPYSQVRGDRHPLAKSSSESTLRGYDRHPEWK
jgi:hypothetical protein